MATENKASSRGLAGILAAFVVGVAAGFFVSTYAAIKVRSHAGLFATTGLGEQDSAITGQEADGPGPLLGTNLFSG